VELGVKKNNFMTEHDRDYFRNEYIRLFMCKTIDDCIELVNIYSEFLHDVILKHHKEPVNNIADAEAKIIIQMMLSKSLYIKKIIEGVSFKSLPKIIDPTILVSFIRTVYETVGLFNLIYRNSKTEEEKKIKYNLWAISGLNYRQRFRHEDEPIWVKTKANTEKNKIESYCNEIYQSSIFEKLTSSSQKIIKKMINKKSFLLNFQKNEVVELKWNDLIDVIGIIKKEVKLIFEKSYTYFSLYSHPSNVAVFQFAQMYDEENKTFMILTVDNMKFFFFLISIFIADYINLFPATINTFEKLSIRDQIVINAHNMACRGSNYSINDVYKNL
jgi:hypothetical protein